MPRRRRAPVGMPFFTSPSPGRGSWPPPVTKGPNAPIPEKRPEVLAKIIARLEEKPQGFRFNYSNGEFISSSLCVARTFEDVAKVEALDTPDYKAYYDEANKLWWRHGGCFD